MAATYDLQALAYDYERYQRTIEQIDHEHIHAHNARYTQDHPYHLHVGMTPCPFEGDLGRAQAIFLLANPHYKDGESMPIDHQRIDGWGLWGLSSTTAPSMHGWWRPRLRSLVRDHGDEQEWQRFSHKVASFQAIGWASQNFHECNSLPSKQLLADTLRKLASERPDLLFVVMRQRSYWQQILNSVGAEVITTKNPRCSYLSLGNFHDPEDWKRVVKRVSGGI